MARLILGWCELAPWLVHHREVCPSLGVTLISISSPAVDWRRRRSTRAPSSAEELLRDPLGRLREASLLQRELVADARLAVPRDREACVLEARPRLVLVGHGIGVVLLSHKVEDLDRGGVGVDECGLPIALVLVDVDLRERHRQRVDRDQRLREAVLERRLELYCGRGGNGAALAVAADDNLARIAAELLRLLVDHVDEHSHRFIKLLAVDHVVVREGLPVEIGVIRVPGAGGLGRRLARTVPEEVDLFRRRKDVLDAIGVDSGDALDQRRQVMVGDGQGREGCFLKGHDIVAAAAVEPVQHDDGVSVLARRWDGHAVIAALVSRLPQRFEGREGLLRLGL
mmetsp:Transcript_17373/g.51101  ORF Transcript_17373/g.51101 Transcript_17373/m.51101 type:complete len:341 (+) Transcript_17373:111-1133(+)